MTEFQEAYTTPAGGEPGRFVVVDEQDGFIFARNAEGKDFTSLTARLFAQVRNSERKPEYRTYAAYKLVPADDKPKDVAP